MDQAQGKRGRLKKAGEASRWLSPSARRLSVIVAFPFLALGYWGALFELASSPSPGLKLTSRALSTPRAPTFRMQRDGFLAEPAWPPHPSPRPLGLATGVPNVQLVRGAEPIRVRIYPTRSLR